MPSPKLIVIRGRAGYLMGIFSLLVLLSFPSCKTKYLELQTAFEKARQRKTFLEEENKLLKADVAVLSDSLSVMVADYNNLIPYTSQIREIEGLKKEFLRSHVPVYIEMKNRQEEKPKKLKP